MTSLLKNLFSQLISFIKEPGEGDERKLFLLITGHTELSIQKAKGEITRIIKEEFTRLQTSYQAPKIGRFKVM
jgi:hypothetical protein